MEMLINGLAGGFGGTVSGGILLVVFKFLLSRWEKIREKREQEREDTVACLDRELKNLKARDLDMLKTQVNLHLEKNDTREIRLEQNALREDLTELTRTVRAHIEADNSRVMDSHLKSIEAVVNKIDNKLDRYAEETAKQSEQIRSNRQFLDNLNDDYQKHKREDHKYAK